MSDHIKIDQLGVDCTYSRSNRKMNTSPSTVDDKDALKKPLCQPLLKKVDLHFPLGMEVTARNLKGVTIKDALDAIHKQYKKRVCKRHITQYRLCIADSFGRLMTRSTSHTLQASNGTRRPITRSSSYTRRRPEKHHPAAKRRRARAATNSHINFEIASMDRLCDRCHSFQRLDKLSTLLLQPS